MVVSPSLIKGHERKDESITSAHIVVIVDQPQAPEFLDFAAQWVNAGVLEPALWVRTDWLELPSEGFTDPVGVVLSRGESPVETRVSLLEALAREPHDHILVSVIAPQTDSIPDGTWSARVEGLLTALTASRPHSRSLGNTSSRATELRVLNLVFPPAAGHNPGIRAALLRSAVVDVENLVVNPEDRPTPISLDTIPRPGTPRWASHVLSSTATIAGLWSSMATSPVVPDANWIGGNVRVVRTFARVVLTHPLVAQVAESTKDILVGDACPTLMAGVQIHPQPMEPMSESLLALRSDQYAESLLETSGLGYFPMEDFEPPSIRKRGFAEGVREFVSFAGDKLAALPKWATRSIIEKFNRSATQNLFGDDSRVVVDARQDLSMRTDDPKLIDAWDFVARQRDNLKKVLEVATEPPEESDDPTPWIALHEAIGLLADAKGNARYEPLTSDHGNVLVAASLDDVIPHPDDEFTIDAQCDALLGGDGTSRQVSWMDVEGAARLDDLLGSVLTRVRLRVMELQGAYLRTERDFFDSQERYLDARFGAEDAAARDARESRIAAADDVFRDGSSEPSGESASLAAHDEVKGAAVGPTVTEDGLDEAWTAEGGSLQGEGHSEVEADDALNESKTQDGEVEVEDAVYADVDFTWPTHPFESPLDEVIAQPDDLSLLWEDATEAALKELRERRLRGALSDVAAAERDRVHSAEEELKILERTHRELSRWVERRASSFVGRVLGRIEAEGQRMNALEESVLGAARASEPEIGARSSDLQRAYVRAVLVGLAVAAGIALVLIAINLVAGFLTRNQTIPVFSGFPWWVIALTFVTGVLLALLLPLLSYFQAWTRERVKAEDARAELEYQTRLVTHVRKERVRLARLHMQVPQRVRCLGLWWHYWDSSRGNGTPSLTPGVPGSEALPHHLRWAVSDWTHSSVFRRIRDAVLKGVVRAGYRSSLIENAASRYCRETGLGSALTVNELARMRSAEAVALVSAWSDDQASRSQSAADLERSLAQKAQELNKDSRDVTPRVKILNPDPIAGLTIETDLLEDPHAGETSTNEFLLEISGDAAEMGHRIWNYGIGVQDFRSYFAGPGRLRDALASTVTFVDVEATKVCSSEVSVRLDITDQIAATYLRCQEPTDQDAVDDDHEGDDPVTD